MGSTELEALGLTIAIKKLECYLRGRTFNLVTDHKALLYIMNKRMDELKPSLARKVMFLSQYDFKMIHKDGVNISNADALSRQNVRIILIVKMIMNHNYLQYKRRKLRNQF